VGFCAIPGSFLRLSASNANRQAAEQRTVIY
jgi:hypothetical protein